MRPVIPVILSGGSGTRLWPLSRKMYPKQFIRLFGDGRASLFGETVTRLPTDAGFSEPIVVCNSDHRFLVREELERLGVTPAAIILEPEARNTAPAIALAALAAVERDAAALIAVMPSDHQIGDDAAFIRAVRQAAEVAATGRHVLFGIKPRTPHTGYGYIRQGAAIAGFDGAFTVEEFVEKPNAEKAQRFLDDGGYSWNSGIFVLNARAYLEDLADLAPEVWRAASAAWQEARADLEFQRVGADAFKAAPSISIDYAVMEHTGHAAVLPLDVDWDDVGSFAALWDVSQRDGRGNAVRGDGVLQDTEGCFVLSEKGLVATVGVKDLVIVDTPDALLVADKARSQDVGRIVEQLHKAGRLEADQHVRNARPWGFFETLNTGPRFQVKRLHVKPGGKLSLQMHHHRSEHWIVVQGTARVVVGDGEQLVRENESVYISALEWHRLENPGKVPLELIEVQIGGYLGEDDIQRREDIYQRAADETK